MSSPEQHHHHHQLQHQHGANITRTLTTDGDTQLTQSPRPIALRPEYITTAETTLIVTNRAEPWHSLDYSVDLEGMTIFTVCGQPWSLGQRKVFHDRSGLPLFELGCPWYNSSTMSLALPGSSGREILHAKLRVAVQAPNVVATFENAVGYRERERSRRREKKKGKEEDKSKNVDAYVPDYVKIEVHRLDLDNLVQVVTVENCRVAYIHRITNREELTEGQRPPFRFRPRWRVTVATGMDVSLISVLVIIVARRLGGDLPSHNGQIV